MINPVADQFLICPPDSKSLTQALRKLGTQSFSWVYLGSSIPEFNLATRIFGDSGVYIDTASRFHEAGQELRDEYLTYVYRIGRGLDSLRWWVTSFSYRSRYLSRTFHRICYLRLGLDAVNIWDNPQPLVLVTDGFVGSALERNLHQRSLSVSRINSDPIGGELRRIKDIVTLAVHRLYFTWREGKRILQARRMLPKPVPVEMPTTVIIGWATLDNVQLGGAFHESYFGKLAAKLIESGCNVSVSPIILRELPYGVALRRLRDSDIPLLVPHRYLRLLDVFKIAISTLTKPPVPQPLPQFCDMDISSLVEEDLHGHWITNAAADALMMVALVHRWKDLGFQLERFIYVYENQPMERALCWAVRRSFPEAKLVGYQHAGVPKLLLNYHLAPEGEPEAPLPDRIVTVGRLTARQLTEGGYPVDQVIVGGALQMQGLIARSQETPSTAGDDTVPMVLVAASDGMEEAAELAYLAANLFGNEEPVRVVFKCHPQTPFQKIASQVGVKWPEHVEISGEPIIGLISRCALMVYSGSTVAVQAVALGVPVIHVNTRFDFDLDPMEEAPELRPAAMGLEEVREKVRWLLQNRDAYTSQHREQWHTFVDEFYGPVTEDTYRAFVEPIGAGNVAED